MIHKKFTYLIAVAMLATLGYTGSAEAGKTVWSSSDNPCNKLSLNGSVRVRFGFDNRDDGNSGTNDSRDRERVRARLGATYMTGKGITAGVRLTHSLLNTSTFKDTTETSSTTRTSGDINSPHQTLGVAGGLPATVWDRVYIAYNAPNGAWVAGGIVGFPAWQQSEAWWDTDIPAQGIVLGWNGKTGNGKLSAVLARIILNENSWTGDNGGSDTDTTAILLGLHHATKISSYKVDFSAYGLSVDDQGSTTSPQFAGGEAFYSIIGARAARGGMKIGFEYFWADIEDALIGTGNEDSDDIGFVIYVRGKFNNAWGGRLYYYNVGVASCPGMGALCQDDFPSSSNFTGFRAQIDYKAVSGYKLDIRYYNQSAKNDDISVSGVGAMGSNTDASRLQFNFNVGF